VRRLRACGVLVLAIAAACSGANARTNSFDTLAGAIEAGVVEQGRLPAGLPPGTRDIRTGYVPGERGSWGLFNFPPDQGSALKQILQPQEISLEGQRVEVPGRIEWWPRALRGRLDGERLGITGLKGYNTLDGTRVVAVNWQQGRGYYWALIDD
jgi:hypothetical protein